MWNVESNAYLFIHKQWANCQLRGWNDCLSITLELIILCHIQLVVKCNSELGESIWCHNQLQFRAIYADISRAYSTDSFLQLLCRSLGMRGLPKMIYSGNGTQLLKHREGNTSQVQRRVWHRWRFCLPGALWINCVTESPVKSIRKALSISIRGQIMEFSVLQNRDVWLRGVS